MNTADMVTDRNRAVYSIQTLEQMLHEFVIIIQCYHTYITEHITPV